jgi:hypothetical protein
MTRLRLAAAATCGLLLAACSSSNGGGTGPVAGSLSVTYSTPNADDGAVLLTLAGAEIDSVSFGSYVGYTRKVNADSVVVVVAGHLAAGTLVTFTVPDKNASASYHAHITQVAQRSTYAQRSLAGYSVSVGP